MLARFILLVSFCILAIAGTVLADTEGHSPAHVYVTVNPNIQVGTLTDNLDLGTIQMGDFHGVFLFRVDANAEAVALNVGTTVLYKGDDPTDPMVDPIPVNLTAGALIEPADANPMGGQDNVANFINAWEYLDFDGWESEVIPFESSQPGTFSQDVAVTVGWTQNDPELPQGEYSGWVVFYGNLEF